VESRPTGEPAGPAVVLLHGVTLGAAIWAYQLAALRAAGLRVVALDQRGHGTSTIGDAGLSLDRLAADVTEVCDRLGVADAVLVGHSMGGMVALRLLAGGGSGAARVRGLALVATSASPVLGSGLPGASAVHGGARRLSAPGRRLSSWVPGAALPRHDLGFVLARITFGSSPSARHIALTQQVTAAVPARVAAELVLEIARFDETAALERVAVPTTVVVGTADVLTPLHHAEAMAAAIPGAELVVLDGCGHMVMLERHEQLDAIVVALAARATPPPR